MANYSHGLIIMLIFGVTTLMTRVLPVIIFGRGEKVPDYLLYLGQTVPFTAMGLLIIYCLKDVSVFSGAHGVPEAIALAVVSGTYLWKKNTIFSVLIGTIVYMVLVQAIF